MKSMRAAVLCVCVLAAAAASAKEKKSAGSHRSSAAAKPRAPKPPPWEQRADPKGFTLKVPPDTTEQRDEWATTFSAHLPPDSALLKATVTVETLDELTPITNLEKAVEAVMAARPRGMKAAVSEQRELPKGYLVIIGPEYDTYAVDVIRNGKEVQVKAHCTGPATHLEKLKQLCLSVKPTK